MADDGGPAFPRASKCDGMSLRDYFAAQALSAIIGFYGPQDPQKVSARAYENADAMLAERNKDTHLP